MTSQPRPLRALLLSVALATILILAVGYLLMPGDGGARRTGAPVGTAPEATASVVTEQPPARQTPTVAVTLAPKPSQTGRPGRRRGPSAPLPSLPTITLPSVTLPVQPTEAGEPSPPAVADFVLSSFNVLGSPHTAPGGKRAHMAPGPVRMRWTVRLLAHHGVDVVGFQEIRDDQVRAFHRLTGGSWDIYPGNSLGSKSAQNSIAWRTSEWQLVRADTVWIPYFNGNPHRMPYIMLEHRATGRRAFFANFHNPASVKRFGSQKRYRVRATTIQINLVRRLRESTGLPVFVTGDMNERAEYYCRLTGATAMEAANGGNNGPGRHCRPPRGAIIDWIFGTPEAQFVSYFTDRGPLVRRTSDHNMVLSRVRLTD